MTDFRTKANRKALDTIDAVEGVGSLPFIQGLIVGLTNDEVIEKRRAKRAEEDAKALADMLAYYD